MVILKLSQRAKLIVALVLWVPIVGFLGYWLCYEPLKYGYMIRRVESAATAADERAAFELAKRWGCCWEIHLESPPRTWLESRKLDEVVRDPTRSLAVELEWLASKPNGVPYRARRTLVEKSNIYVLTR
jgi:hypothetical protein